MAEPLDYAARAPKRPVIRQSVLWVLFAVLVFVLLVVVFAPVAPPQRPPATWITP